MKKRSLIMIICAVSIVFNVLLVGILSFGKSDEDSDWLVKLKQENDSNWAVISLKDFTEFYRALIMTNVMNSTMAIEDSGLKELMNDQEAQKKALESLINYTVLTKEAVSKSVIDVNDIKKQAKQLLTLIEKQIIMREYLLKEILPKIKVSEKEVSELFDKYKKNWKGTAEQLQEQITSQIKFQKASEYLMNNIKELADSYMKKRNSNLIKRLKFK